MKLSQRLALNYIRAKFKLLSSISKKKAAEKAFELFCTPRNKNILSLPKIFSQAESLQFNLDGNPVKGWKWGNDAGKKVLINHGFESTVVNFEKYIRLLAAKGYTVLAFDAPAHGRSGGKKINAPLYKKMIVEINNRFGPVHSFLAHSFGGLAVCLALEEIGVIQDCRLVLIAPATETSTAIDGFFELLKLDSSIRPEFDKVIWRKGGKKPEWYSIKRTMMNIKANVLWIHDEDDEITPLKDVLNVRSENHDHIQFVITKGLGHRRIYRDNAVAKRVVDFL